MITRVLSNCSSRHAARYLPSLRAALPESPIVEHIVTREIGELAAVFRSGAWCATDLLVLNGGDGSVQRALTALIEHCPAERWPRISLLPAGTTNMTAFDVNEQRGYRQCLTALRGVVADGRPAQERLRRLVCVGSARMRAAGFFFGIGTIVQGIEYFHRRVSANGGGHELGAGVAMVRTLWGIARKQPPFDHAQAIRLDGPDFAKSIAIAMAETLPAEPPQHDLAIRLCLITGLERLLLGARPYWAQECETALRGTVVEARAAHFVTTMPLLLRGRPNARMTPQTGYHSSSLDRLRLAFDGPFTLDGELYANEGNVMTLQASQPLRMVSL